MPGVEFKYVVPRVKPFEFPDIPKPEGAKLTCTVRDNEVHIIGNGDGLLFLARHLVAMGLIDGVTGLHIHLDPEIGNLDTGSNVVTIGNLDFGTTNQSASH
jgi:hypothetical protein